MDAARRTAGARGNGMSTWNPRLLVDPVLRALSIVVLAFSLASCCSHEEIRIEGSSETGVMIYDPNNDTIYWFNTKNWDMIRYQHWNKRDR